MEKPSASIDVLTPPQTPPWESLVLVHNWPEPDYVEGETVPEKQYSNGRIVKTRGDVQEVLILHAPKQKYAHTREYPIPTPQDDRELLISVEVVGLNPIDWKAP